MWIFGEVTAEPIQGHFTRARREISRLLPIYHPQIKAAKSIMVIEFPFSIKVVAQDSFAHQPYHLVMHWINWDTLKQTNMRTTSIVLFSMQQRYSEKIASNAKNYARMKSQQKFLLQLLPGTDSLFNFTAMLLSETPPKLQESGRVLANEPTTEKALIASQQLLQHITSVPIMGISSCRRSRWNATSYRFCFVDFPVGTRCALQECIHAWFVV